MQAFPSFTQSATLSSSTPSMAEAKLQALLELLIDLASRDTREAPWYGSWNMRLTREIFPDTFCDDPVYTATYPQFSLAEGVDTCEPDPVNETPKEVEPFDVRLLARGPTTPTKPRGPRQAAPSPDTDRLNASRTTLLSTPPPESPDSTRGCIGSPHSTISDSAAPPIKSTRIPDFVQFLYKVISREPLVVKKMTLLLVEVKPAHRDTTPPWTARIRAFEQTREQAFHAFVNDPDVDRLGIIVAFGDTWSYREYPRAVVMQTKDYRSWSEVSYENGSADPKADLESWGGAQAYEPVSRHFVDGFATFGTDRSNRALAALKGRMAQIRDGFAAAY